MPPPKAGLINLTHSLARLYSVSGVTANAIAPGLVATDMIKKELNSKAGKQKAAQIPVGRIAEPSEIAAGVLYLASDGAGYVTGQTLDINGGMLMSWETLLSPGRRQGTGCGHCRGQGQEHPHRGA